MQKQTILLFFIFNLAFLLSCKENNKSLYFNHPIPDYKEILKTRYAKYDNNTHIINHLNEFAYYKQAIIQTKKENWNDFTNVYLKNIEIPDSLRTISAEIYIDKILKANDIVLLNETHDLPQHRVLAHSFLEKIKGAGYKYISVEALNNNPEKTAFTEDLINYNSAIYTKEPYFVNFLNQAKKMGFNLRVATSSLVRED